MAAAAKSTQKKTVESKWARLVREAKKDLNPPTPYEFDAYEPPVLISPPVGIERTLMLARLADSAGMVSGEDLPDMIEALVGEDAFPKVWAVLRDEPIEVTLALIDDLNRHFNGGADAGAEELPGGESASQS